MFPFIFIGIGAYLMYRYGQGAQTGNFSKVPNVGGPGKTSAQPGQQYPFRPAMPARVDNSNQPWYGGPRASLLGGNPSSGPAPTANQVTNPLAVANSAVQLWQNLGVSDWFSSNTPSQDDGSGDDGG